MTKRDRSTTQRPMASAVEACCPRSRNLRPKATKSYAPLFKALGDETRLEIVGLLAAQGRELCVCDIESRFDLGQPTVSHHLRILREAGIVTAERRGTWVYYRLDASAGAQVRAFGALLGE